MSGWKHAVVVTREDVLRRYFIEKDCSNLNSRESLIIYAKNCHYNRRYHGLRGDDQGYIVFNDVTKERRIFVTTKEVGLSRSFHEDNEISF